MEKLIWLFRWPWIFAVIVFVGLSQLPFGPWYVSAWFDIGAAMMVMSLAITEKRRLMGVIAVRAETIRLAAAPLPL